MRRFWGWIARDWKLKLAALGIAVLVWSAVKAEETMTVTVNAVPVNVDLRDPGWELAGRPSPATVSVDLTGPVRELLRVAVARPRVVLPLEEVHDSLLVAVIRSNWVHLDGGLTRTRVEDVHPATVRLVFDPVATRLVPVAVPIRGELPDGLRLTAAVTIEPAAVRVSGPRRLLQAMDSVRLPPLDLAHLKSTTALRMDIDTAGLGLVLRPTSVRVRVPIAPDTLRVGADSVRPAPKDSAVQARPVGKT